MIYIYTHTITGTHKQAFDEYLLKINKALSYVQCELRGFRNQYDGRVYYGVVNTVSDEQSKLGTKYSVPQIAFYKAIVSMAILIFDKKIQNCPIATTIDNSM